ncbi:hypothetical protein THAOC_07850, partial [Thalassiosira oceanica]
VDGARAAALDGKRAKKEAQRSSRPTAISIADEVTTPRKLSSRRMTPRRASLETLGALRPRPKTDAARPGGSRRERSPASHRRSCRGALAKKKTPGMVSARLSETDGARPPSPREDRGRAARDGQDELRGGRDVTDVTDAPPSVPPADGAARPPGSLCCHLTVRPGWYER